MMKLNGWATDFFLFNTLLNMCADLGLVEEAERLFKDMKRSESCSPDSWSYTAMLNIYGSNGNDEKALWLFEKMSRLGIELNVMGCTCLIQCLGKANRIDDLVRVFNAAVEGGLRPDDRLCGWLLSVVSLSEESEDADKVLACLELVNPKLVVFVRFLVGADASFEQVKEEFKAVIGDMAIDVRRPFCNCLIDICRTRNRSRETTNFSTSEFRGLYPGLHNKTADELVTVPRTSARETGTPSRVNVGGVPAVWMSDRRSNARSFTCVLDCTEEDEEDCIFTSLSWQDLAMFSLDRPRDRNEMKSVRNV